MRLLGRALIQTNVLIKRSNWKQRHRLRDDPMRRTQQEGGHLQAKERDLRTNKLYHIRTLKK